ncbi:sialidase family protein [Nakamurella aerolata]|uniref:Exo-alpha-sialidase n=1 Tax=Nakamurella aerolata TaxID=1656892 RepID=A0A849A525_9ACTN|nr:sialidase family protein [Nakamurella aerolata]NNG36094.1 exo-alpha-sialidase [Nakamurella aerolata]
MPDDVRRQHTDPSFASAVRSAPAPAPALATAPVSALAPASVPHRPGRHRAAVTQRRRHAAARGRARLAALSVLIVGGATLAVLPGGPGVQAATPESGGDPQGSAVGLGSVYYPYSPAAGTQATNPHMAVVDTVGVVNPGEQPQRVPQVFLAAAQNADVAAADSDNKLIVSHDGAKTFSDYRKTNMAPQSLVQLADGSLLAPQFIPRWTDAARTQLDIVSQVSTGGGKTFVERLGRFVPTDGKNVSQSLFDRGMRLHKGTEQLPDGTIITAAYTRLTGDPAGRSVILQSKDAGATWTVRGSINTPVAGHTTNEVGMARTVDGRLIAILRASPQSDGLLQAYSSDDGKTWTKPVKIAAPTDTVDAAIEPSIVLQPNGILVLAFGRPDNNMLISADGKGDDWSDPKQLFENRPADGYWTHGSSGNTTMVSLDGSRSLVAGDLCAAWGCQEQGEQYGVWARTIDAVGPNVGKLDLTSMVAQGKAKLTGTFDRTAVQFPQTRPSGAVDGSSQRFAAAKLKPISRDPAQLTLELDRSYPINRIGLMLAAGVAQDAVVQLSPDGKTWGAPVITASKRVDFSLRYQDFAVQQAKYVRVLAPAGGTLTGVTELEVYRADAQTFENDPVNAVPRGWVDSVHATVVDYVPSMANQRQAGLGSRRALRLLDHDSAALALATRPFGARDSVSVQTDVAGMTINGGMLIDINGTKADGSAGRAYHLHLNLPGKSISWWDGGKWNLLGTLTDPPVQGQWRNLKLDVSTTGGTLTFGSQTFRLTQPQEQLSKLSSVSFGSVGTGFTGSSYYLDNVSIG